MIYEHEIQIQLSSKFMNILIMIQFIVLRKRYYFMNHFSKLPIKQIINKRELMKLNYLLTLPYPKLLNELYQSFPAPQKNQKNHHSEKQLMILSSHHDCKYLYLLSKSKEIAQNHLQVPNDQAKSQKWFSIINEGLAQLFNNSIHNQKPNNQSVQNKFNNIVQYFQNIRQICTQSQQFIDWTQRTVVPDLMQILFYSLPTVFNSASMTHSNLQALKRQYVRTLSVLLQKIYSESNQIYNLKLSKLFPVELFNYTDQPLLKDIYIKYLHHQLKYDNNNSKISWLSRFGLPCDAYLYEWTQSCLKQLNNNQRNIVTDLNTCNNIFVIVRKIIGISSKSCTLLQQNIVKIVQKIIHNMLFFRSFKNLNPGQGQNIQIQVLINKIFNQNLSSQLQKQQQIQKSNIMLYNKIHRKQRQDIQQQLLYKSGIIKVIEYKIIRMLLLYLHISLLSTNQNSIKMSRTLGSIINHPKVFNYVYNNIKVGDIAAQLSFADQKYYSVFGQYLFNVQSPYYNLLKLTHQQYSSLILQIQGKNLPYLDFSRVWSKKNQIEYLLTGQSRLLYNSPTIFSQKIQQNLQLSLASLLNDNQYLSTHPTSGLATLIKSKLNQNLQLNIEDLKLKQYPYFPAFKITDNIDQSKYIYLRENICKHKRIKLSSKNQVVDMSKIRNIKDFIEQYKN